MLCNYHSDCQDKHDCPSWDLFLDAPFTAQPSTLPLDNCDRQSGKRFHLDQCAALKAAIVRTAMQPQCSDDIHNNTNNSNGHSQRVNNIGGGET